MPPDDLNFTSDESEDVLKLAVQKIVEKNSPCKSPKFDFPSYECTGSSSNGDGNTSSMPEFNNESDDDSDNGVNGRDSSDSDDGGNKGENAKTITGRFICVSLK